MLLTIHQMPILRRVLSMETMPKIVTFEFENYSDRNFCSNDLELAHRADEHPYIDGEVWNQFLRSGLFRYW